MFGNSLPQTHSIAADENAFLRGQLLELQFQEWFSELHLTTSMNKLTGDQSCECNVSEREEPRGRLHDSANHLRNSAKCNQGYPEDSRSDAGMERDIIWFSWSVNVVAVRTAPAAAAVNISVFWDESIDAAMSFWYVSPTGGARISGLRTPMREQTWGWAWETHRETERERERERLRERERERERETERERERERDWDWAEG